MQFDINPSVENLKTNWSRNQVFFFVMDSRKANATAVDFFIDMFKAKTEARKIGGCVRVGRIVDGKAETM